MCYELYLAKYDPVLKVLCGFYIILLESTFYIFKNKNIFNHKSELNFGVSEMLVIWGDL